MSCLRVSVFSDVLKRYVHMNISLPEGMGENTPMLVLLHGMTDDDTCWQRRTSVERYADETGIAVIMPGAGLSWYCDTPYGERYFEFVSKEVAALARRMLPGLTKDREKTFVGGLSMGGYGALKCALKCPETYSAAVSLSGALDVMRLPDLVDPNTVGGFDWEEAFGPLKDVPDSENDLLAACETDAVKDMKAYIWCGTDDSLIGMSRAIRERLDGSCKELVYRETEGGHEWRLWDRELQYAMQWLSGKGVSAWH